MFDIITIGSATKDIFLGAEKLRQNNCFCLPLGEKIELEKVLVFSGGGGVNTASTFALQGLNTAFCGAVGQDIFGQEIIEELNERGIDTEMVKTKPGKLTDLGIIFQAESERTILLHHTASQSFSEKDIDWQKLKESEWLYIAPLWGKAAGLTEKLTDSRGAQKATHFRGARKTTHFAKENNIKIALNPSLNQLALPGFKEIIKNISVLILNDDEASFLTGIKPFQEKSVFQKTRTLTKAIIVITKGKQGASVFDGRDKALYQMPAPPIKVVDATGAGDSFGAGFVAGLIQTKNTESPEYPRGIEKAMQLAMANAVSNIQVLGANKGLLAKGEKFTPVVIKKSML